MVCGHPVVGTLDDIPDILINTAIDNVIFIVPRSALNDIEKQILCCETLGVTSHVAVDLFPMQFTQGRPETLLDMPIMTFESVSGQHQQLIIKRLLDIVLSGIGLLILSPVFLATALLVKFTSDGPVFFVQERCSLNGRRFKLFKFRTMVLDAEAKIAELMAFNQMEGPAFKMDNDPRITPVGKFLRKLSIDELPQLWNVFLGDMSLVGPRPPLPKEVQQYDFWQRRRLSMRPGITCLWQVGGRNTIKDFDEWAKLDLKYIDEWSLALDFKILFKTIPVVLIGSGAK
jgi:exopolysaccharide biosynthesis polyprenyl glycosylphosphotransferase